MLKMKVTKEEVDQAEAHFDAAEAAADAALDKYLELKREYENESNSRTN